MGQIFTCYKADTGDKSGGGGGGTAEDPNQPAPWPQPHPPDVDLDPDHDGDLDPDPDQKSLPGDRDPDDDDAAYSCPCPALEIPLAGNAFLTSPAPSHHEVITSRGLANWVSPSTVCSIYFCPSDAGHFNLSLRLAVPARGRSVIKVSIGCEDEGQQSYTLDVGGEAVHDVKVGRFDTPCGEGYVKLDLQGVSKTGGYFADVSHVIVTSTSCRSMVCVQEDFDFHFGRRGPSVHLNFDLSQCGVGGGGGEGIEYFYNEVTVPEGLDAVGSYFCAIAFSSGYFGIQVNSADERRVLFSIWSTFAADDPSSIPAEFQVRVRRRGDDVCVGEFGNEGSGGQSYLVYDWVPGATYKFLVRGGPSEEDSQAGSSEFTAWFYSPLDERWRLIATFVQPKNSTWLTGLYSFCENFCPEAGHLERMALFGNQWARGRDGVWAEVTKAKFTGDETSKKSRNDFAGGVWNGRFFLKNCGFFNGTVARNVTFVRDPVGSPPDLDLGHLP